MQLIPFDDEQLSYTFISWTIGLAYSNGVFIPEVAENLRQIIVEANNQTHACVHCELLHRFVEYLTAQEKIYIDNFPSVLQGVHYKFLVLCVPLVNKLQ